MTTPEQHEQIERLFHELSELDLSERGARLAAIGAEDPDLATEVGRLLAHARDTAAVQNGIAHPCPESLIGERIGPYRIDELLGAGGMGVVYSATRAQPVERRVALKLIRWGVDSQEVVARFESERQTLALMSHPNIAQVFDAGTAPDGRPYFVMELVPGPSITKYCDAERLGTRARLDLFVQVCDAVRHAHQRGVIHRDLKPSNVIVASVGGEPVPKVIDFGVAKATEQRSTRKTIFTEIGQLVGTPEYMSPEQADRAHRDIDTRSDVYALGVLLYELLSGYLPFDAATLREAGLSAILREIREVDPPKPSTRIRALDDTSQDAARRRGTEPRTLARTLDGDLDWIVMRAMEKDRERRYPSVADFAADIRNYLGDRPVEAGPPSLTYRARKFVRRHRVLVGATAAVTAALLLGFVGTGMALVRAVDAERVAAEERDNAELRRNIAEQVSYFLVRLFESTDPTKNDPTQITVEHLLERGVERVDEDLKEQPSVRADVLRTLGRVYASMGHYQKGRELLERAVELRDGLANAPIPDVSGDLGELAIVYRRLGEFDAAIETHRKALALLERSGLGDGIACATQLNGLAIVQIRLADWEAARAALERAIEIFVREGDPAELVARSNLGLVLGAMGDDEAAVGVLETLLEQREAIDGPEHPRTAGVLNTLANSLVNIGEFDRAIPLYDRALAIWTRSLGPRHLDVARVHNNVGYLYGKQERWEEAILEYERALEIKEAVYGADHTELISALTNLGSTCTKTGDYAAAEVTLLRGREIAGASSASPRRPAFNNLKALGSLRLAQKRYRDAEPLLEQALHDARELYGDEHPTTGRLLGQLAEAFRGEGRAEEADRLDEEAQRIRDAAEK